MLCLEHLPVILLGDERVHPDHEVVGGLAQVGRDRGTIQILPHIRRVEKWKVLEDNKDL